VDMPEKTARALRSNTMIPREGAMPRPLSTPELPRAPSIPGPTPEGPVAKKQRKTKLQAQRATGAPPTEQPKAGSPLTQVVKPVVVPPSVDPASNNVRGDKGTPNANLAPTLWAQNRYSQARKDQANKAVSEAAEFGMIEMRRLGSKGWLSNTEIDRALSQVRREETASTDAETRGLWQRVRIVPAFEYDSWICKTKLPVDQYARKIAALLQESGGWEDDTLVIIPMNFDNMHWILGVIDVRSKTISVRDSLALSPGASELSLRRYNKTAPILASFAVAGSKASGLAPSTRDEWRTVNKSSETPQQENTHDCGVHTVLNAWCSVHGVQHSFGGKVNIVQTRQALAVLVMDSTTTAERKTTLERKEERKAAHATAAANKAARAGQPSSSSIIDVDSDESNSPARDTQPEGDSDKKTGPARLLAAKPQTAASTRRRKKLDDTKQAFKTLKHFWEKKSTPPESTTHSDGGKSNTMTGEKGGGARAPPPSARPAATSRPTGTAGAAHSSPSRTTKAAAVRVGRDTKEESHVGRLRELFEFPVEPKPEPTDTPPP
jgi:hypothetical protein